jgi:hypothetical protein
MFDGGRGNGRDSNAAVLAPSPTARDVDLETSCVFHYWITGAAKSGPDATKPLKRYGPQFRHVTTPPHDLFSIKPDG